MTNLFSSFDPQVSIFYFSWSMNWISIISVLFILPQMYWITGNQVSSSTGGAVKAIMTELSAVLGLYAVPGVHLIFLTLFFFILSMNFLGLMPYVFTASSHLVFTLSLSLPLWLGSTLFAVAWQFTSVMAHLVPSGTPAPLMPVMVLIETISSVIRPFTLAVRLAANMIAGHLLLTLLGGQGSFNLAGSVVLGALILLLMLECAVACIQAYVFTILSSLYLGEVASSEMANKMA